MEAIGLFFAKFSEELLNAQIALFSLCLAISVYWILIRKKKRESSEWVPAALVRAYLDRLRTDEEETRFRLFGENIPHRTPMGGPIMGNDPALQKEVEALRAQLSMADARAMEADKSVNGLKAEKATLEQKLKDALAAGATSGGGPSAAQMKEIQDLTAKLQEYEVIEDDLVNLKKFQQENEQLKAELAKLKGGAAPSAEAAPAPAAPAPAAPAAAAPAPAAPAAVAPAAASAAASAEAAPAAPGAAPAAAGDKSTKQKEEELLSEFEKMLAS